ncbi:MAG: hypothetical protein HC812_09450, partial [Leptolyngbya sp. RL_3_1]|nr:hypothetical protein [Leptolyngbya sp. RL_3_1]
MTPAAAPTGSFSSPNQQQQVLGLAIHSSTPHLGLALGHDSSQLKQSVESLGRAMSHQLQTRLMDFMA